MEPQEITLARAAYERYGSVTDFKNFMGNPMPAYDELPAKIQEAWVAAANPMPTVDSINRQVGILLGGEDEQGNNLSAGEVRDGYNSFNELYDHLNKLYDHRIENYIALARNRKHLLTGNTAQGEREFQHCKSIWRSKAHSYGAVWDDWFLLGIHSEPGAQITYHLPISRWDDCAFAVTARQGPRI